MKTNFLKLALCAFVGTLPIGAWADEAEVSTTKTWLFDDLTTGTRYNTISCINDEYYLRGSAKPTRYFSVVEESHTLTFSDGYVVSVNKCISSNAQLANTDFTKSPTAGTEEIITKSDGENSILTSSFAFNATVAGTLYVYMSTAADKKLRIYFNNVAAATQTPTVADKITEVSYTSTVAGTFFIGGPDTSYKIYAVRFVPTSEKEDEWVYIGSTGYATWSNLSGKDIESLPSGLTAYSATAGAIGSATINLSKLSKMRRANGYVLRGTANTNYPLTYGGTSLGSEYNGGDMQRATADMADFAATIVGDDSKTRYRYILGNDNGTAKFFVPSGSGTLKKGKAYLQTLKDLTATPGARGIDIVFEDEITTAVSTVVTKPINDGKYYNLQGVEVAQPTKGLYIVNGRKVVIK